MHGPCHGLTCVLWSWDRTLDPDWLAEDHPHPRVRRLAALEARAENAATSLEDRCDEIFKALVILDEIGQATYHQRRELLLARRKRFQGKA